MTLVKFKHQNRQVDPWVDGIFSSLFNDAPTTRRQAVSVNISESPEQYEIELAAPGFKKTDFDIHIEKSVLHLSAEKKMEKKEDKEGEAPSEKKYSKREFSYESFTRSFTLPENVDETKISANYDDGVLTIGIMKKEPAKESVKQIQVK